VSAKAWTDANQRHLANEIAEVRALLEAKAGREPLPVPPPPEAGDRPYALDVVAHVFGLSPFERQLLVLCAAIELDSAVAPLCASLQGDANRTYPTFSLALGVLPDPHWSAITPGAPLRRWRLIDLTATPPLTTAPLRIDERVLHYLAGIDQVDERLAAIGEPIAARHALAPSREAVASKIASLWSAAVHDRRDLGTIQICGSDAGARRAVAAAACAKVGLTAFAMSALVLPLATSELDALARLCEREAWLTGSAIVLDCDAVDSADAPRMEAVRQFASRLSVPLLVAAREPRETGANALATVDMARPPLDEQRRIWSDALGESAARMNGDLDRVAWQFALAPERIHAIAASLGDDATPATLWDSCRTVARRRLDDLAQRIDSRASWNDLVLPEAQRAILREVIASVRFRARVYDDWGFAAKDWRGLGVTALFAGVSGTGKTLAAEVLANELRLDLYRVDLSGVISKYIGETEKNLRRVFEAAEEGGSILLFDEADALFGKRSEVKDSHDRYANIEVSYLLQRMEAYRGVAILTTNARDALDPAFLRRIRFAVQFPFPGPVERAEIWRRIFPRELPTEDIAIDKLARLSVTGGSIRNIAVNAAFVAARDESAVRMPHLLAAARAEYLKLEKTLPGSEVEGWA
jgi:hypothetical protein